MTIVNTRHIFRFLAFLWGSVFIGGSAYAYDDILEFDTQATSTLSTTLQFGEFQTQNLNNSLIHTFHLQPWERVNAVTLSKAGNLLAAGSPFGIHLFDLRSYEEILSLKTPNWTRSVALANDGTLLAAGLYDHTIQLLRTSDGTLIKTLSGHTDWVREVSFTSDGAILASVSDDDTVRLWNVSDGSFLHILGNDGSGVACIAFSPDNTILAVGTRDGKIQLWRVQDGVLLNTLAGHTDWVRTLEFSHNGKFLASGAFDATARIWRVSDGESLHALRGHSSSVLGIAFSPDDRTLATGSVDTTIRLWHVDEGHLQTILTGHRGFVYDVAISSDGEKLVSGSDDATIRVWDLERATQTTDEATANVSTSGDCRVCHHPPSTTKPPAVLDVSCEVCHIGGAGLNWCPQFPPLLKAPIVAEGNTISAGQSIGISIPSSNLSISIATPSNGESLYAHPNYTAPVQVTGQVAYTDMEVSQIDVYLELWSEGIRMAILPVELLPDGSFSIDLGINPNGDDPVQSATQLDAGSIVCDDCHTEYLAASFLPHGEVQIIAWATTPEDQFASDSRWVTVDVSSTSELYITVVDELTGSPVPGVSVDAVTRLYEWRPRNFSGITGKDGVATIALETLSQASTTYAIDIPGQIVNGRYYAGTQAVEVSYQPGESSIQNIALMVEHQIGQILGRLQAPGNVQQEALSVWAFHPPSGPIYVTETSAGNFAFAELPISDYLVFPDFEALELNGLMGSAQKIDLSASFEGELEIRAIPHKGTILSGRVVDQETGWLPFAWITRSDGSLNPVDVFHGEWVTSLSSSDQSVAINAPGYYSQTITNQSDQSTKPQTIALKRSPELRSISVGNGEIFIPAESQASVELDSITLETGWLWGYGSHDHALLIRLPEADIKWSSGKFAIERLPNQTTWLYLLDGSAEIKAHNSEDVILVQPGMMVAIPEKGQIVSIPYNRNLVSALKHSTETISDIVWEPTWNDNFQSYLGKFAVGTAQLVTFSTYSLILLSMVSIPLAKLLSKIIRSRRRGNEALDEEG